MQRKRALIYLIAPALFLAAPAAYADPSGLLALQRYDRQLNTIGYRLAAANVSLCAATTPLTGFSIHDLSQYSADQQADARAAFGFIADPLVLAVAPDSPAAAAGLREGDALVSIDGGAIAPARPGSRRSYSRIETLLAQLDRAAADHMLDLGVRRDGRLLTIHAPAPEGCPSRFQTKVSGTIDSLADGIYVEITTGAMDFAGEEDQIAAIVAHELAHNILHHRERLNAVGIRRGLLGQFGRNARRIRQTEEEADILSVYLLDRAGYSPQAIVKFWEHYDRAHILGFLAAPTHPSPKARIAMVERETARIVAMKAAGETPRPLFMMGATLPALR
ncbi:M48 family metallopeptidase [Sphingomonas sp. LB-2]|uniref:M48 family metallopeptidase n=1 Tax=Sphingomonas caeni TaxID=2984949 RepID=UPI00222F3279|nr:M48 family metallopeptidase [Sphingomonas caeni]MCW3848509.1 M48 family metallopeptidase [Sphingomonas caeni]